MRHVIIDGSNYINIALYRCMSSLKRDAPDKLEEWIDGSVRKLFFQMLNKLRRDFRETSQYYIIWDHPKGSAWRKEQLSEYKATRSHSPYLQRAIAIGKQLADELNVLSIELYEAEADDAIYALCSLLPESAEVIVVSRDQDMLQIVQEKHADRVFDPVSKKDLEVPDYDIVAYKSLVGDSSDNISGVKGIGPKRALELLKQRLEELEEPIRSQALEFRKIIAMRENPSLQKNIIQLKEILNENSNW